MIKLDSRPKEIPKNKILMKCEYCGCLWLISVRELNIVENKGMFPRCDCKRGHSDDLAYVSGMK